MALGNGLMPSSHGPQLPTTNALFASTTLIGPGPAPGPTRTPIDGPISACMTGCQSAPPSTVRTTRYASCVAAPTPTNDSHATSSPLHAIGPLTPSRSSSAAGIVNDVVQVAPPSTVCFTSFPLSTHPTFASPKQTDDP